MGRGVQFIGVAFLVLASFTGCIALDDEDLEARIGGSSGLTEKIAAEERDLVEVDLAGCEVVELLVPFPADLFPMGPFTPVTSEDGQLMMIRTPYFTCGHLILDGVNEGSVSGFLGLIEVEPLPDAMLEGAERYFLLSYAETASPVLHDVLAKQARVHVGEHDAMVSISDVAMVSDAQGEVTISRAGTKVAEVDTVMAGMPEPAGARTWGYYVHDSDNETVYLHKVDVTEHNWHPDGTGLVSREAGPLPVMAEHRNGFGLSWTFDALGPVIP